jgi:Immunoglobulin I-set domain
VLCGFHIIEFYRVCEEGESVRFHCVISGQPIPWTTWDKDGIIVNPTSRTIVGEKDDSRFLEVEEVSFDDAGLYRITLGKDILFLL